MPLGNYVRLYSIGHWIVVIRMYLGRPGTSLSDL